MAYLTGTWSMHLAELQDRNIAILGAGREGCSVWRWLRGHFPGKPITIYDEQPSLQSEPLFASDALTDLRAGTLDSTLLATHDVLIRSPGISPYRLELQALKGGPCKVTSASNLWFANFGGEKTVCITGTKGKSTTAALVAHLLAAAGKQVQLAGNIGEPLLGCHAQGIDWWVIELSSYQLADLEARPDIAAIINISDEHLDWHGGAQAYRSDKLRLATLSGDAPLVLNHADAELRLRFETRTNVHWFGEQGGWHVKHDVLNHGQQSCTNLPRESLPGAHNLENLAAALTIVERTGVVVEDLAAALETFQGLPHRLQSLGTRNGVRYVNDSLSTTPVATLAALHAFRGTPVVLIIGGLDRGLDWRPLLPQIREAAPVAMICMPDNGPRVAAQMEEAGFDLPRGVHCVADLAEAVSAANQLAQAGAVILLSPGAPSFPRFKDYADRGRQFARLAGVEAPDQAG